MGDASGALFLILAIVVWATSPAKWHTFKRMAVAFVATAVLGVVVGLAAGRLYSSPPLAGAIAQWSVSLGIVAALIMGRQHVRLLKKAAEEGKVAKAGK
jgi:hydrogenase/urease accessory protein HupE